MRKSLIFGVVAVALMMLAGCAYDYSYPSGYVAADTGKVKTHS